MKLSSFIKLSAGILLAASGLFIFFKDVDTHKLYLELSFINYGWFIAAMAFVVMTIYFRALRMRYLLPDNIQYSNKSNLFSNVAIGFMCNNILPARLGEAARAFLLWQKNRYPVVICIWVIILERIIDLVLFLLFFIIPVYFIKECSPLYFYALIMSGIITVIMILIILYIRFNVVTTRCVKWLIEKLPERFRKKSLDAARNLSISLVWLNSPREFLLILFFSFLTLFCYPAMIVCLGKSSGVSIGILEGMFVQAFAAFGAAIPLTPGFVGTLHAVMLQGFLVLGIDADKARALIILYHGINYILITIIGIILFFRLKLTFSEIFNAEKRMKKE